MAGHARDKKGQFKKGYNGLVKVGSKAGKTAKLKGQLKDRRLTTKTTDGTNVTTRVRDVGPNATLAKPGTSKAGTVPAGTDLKLSKNQKARVDARPADLKAGRESKIARKAPAGKSEQQHEQEKNNARLLAPAQKTPQQKIEVKEAKGRRKTETKREFADAVASPPPPTTKAELDRAKADLIRMGFLNADGSKKARPAPAPARKPDSKELTDTKRALEKERSLLKTFERTKPGGDWVSTSENRIRMLENKLKHLQEQDASKAKAAKKDGPPTKKPAVVSPGKAAEIARLKDERRAAGEEMGSIRQDYDGDPGYHQDPGYKRAEAKSDNLSRELAKLEPNGGWDAQAFDPAAIQRQFNALSKKNQRIIAGQRR